MTTKKQIILVFGGGNVEHNYMLKDRDFKLGAKLKSSYIETYGGGGYNVSVRLAHYGEYAVIPILNLGNDALGQSMFHYMSPLLSAANDGCGLESFYSQEQILVPGISTNSSVIMSSNNQRTILYQDAEYSHRYFEYVKQCIAAITSNPSVYDAIITVVIGHIREDGELQGAITREIISAFSNKTIFWQPGNTQIQFSYDFWKDDLQNITFLQLNLSEMKQFVGSKIAGEQVLYELLQFFLLVL